MPRISFASPVLQHIEFLCPHIPADPKQSGNFMFHFDGRAYDVSDATLAAIHEQLDTWGEKYSSLIRLNVLGESPVAIPPEVQAAIVETPPAETTVSTEPAEPTELTELELEEIQVAVNLLDNKTIADATPILKATAADKSKSALWRQTYVEYASTEEKLPKGLRAIASDLYCEMI